MARYTGAMRRTGHLVAVIVVVVSAHGATAEVALAPGEIVIADRGGAGVSGALYRLVAGGVPRAIATTEPLLKPTAVAIDRDGTLVVADLRRLDEPGRVVRVDPVSGAVTSLADGWPLLSPIGVAIDGAGDVLVADPDAGSRLDFARGSLAGTGAIYRIPHTIGAAVLLALDCCRWNASDVAITPTGELAVVDLGFAVFSGDGTLTLVDPRTGVQRAVATSIPLLDPSGIATGANGALIVTEATNPQSGNAAVLSIEPITGTVTSLATGAPITDPRGIDTTPAGDVVIADSAARMVYRIDLPERTLTVLAQGAPFVVPWDVAVAR
jgi:DNA-binding beta-propeller fold protein YncE